MSKINSNASSLIDEYIANKPVFAKVICELLRDLIHKSEPFIIEDWKWSIPIFQKIAWFVALQVSKTMFLLLFLTAQL